MSFSAGDHLKIQCVGYTHHGLYVGNGMVIHKNRNGVEFSTEEEFSEGASISVVQHMRPSLFTNEEAISRAESRIGEDSYNVFFDNCEHFVMWCKFGVEESKQVRAACTTAFHAMNAAWREYQAGKIPESVLKFFVQNPGALQRLITLDSTTNAVSGALLSALTSLGFTAEAATGCVLASGLVGSAIGTAASVAVTSSSTSTVVGLGAGLAVGSAAAVGTFAVAGTSVVAGVAAVGAASVASVVVAPIAVAAGVGYCAKKLFDLFTD